MKCALILMLILLLASALSAQEATQTPDAETTEDAACPSLVRSALDLTQLNCEGTGINQACYGYIFLSAEPRPGLDEFNFNQPGDRVGLIDVQALQLSAMDTQSGQWGVMVMKVEARLEDGAVSPEDVQILLFGDTQLTDAANWVQVTAATDVNIRRTPGANGEVLAVLPAGQTIVANSRLEDSSWLRVRLNESTAGVGWIATQFLEPASDLDALPVISEQDAAAGVDDISASYGPMQAFMFQSGSDDSPCSEAPNSGMLIQTPEGVAAVTIWMDEVTIQLDGTGYVQADAGGALTVNVLEGSAQVEAQGDSRTVIEGQSVSVDLDENGMAASVPGDPAPLDSSAVQSVPVELLDDPVTVAQPVNLPSGVPLAGTWAFSFDVAALTCPDGTEVVFSSSGVPATIQPQADGLLMSGLRFAQDTPGVYRATYSDADGSLHQDTLQVVASDRIIGEKVLDLANPICTLNVPFRLQLVSQ